MVCTLRSQFTDGSVNDWRIFVSFTERSKRGQDNVIQFFLCMFRTKKNAKKVIWYSNCILKYEVEPLLNDKEQLPQKPMAFFFFQEVSQIKDVLQPVPDQERKKSQLKRRSYLSVSMKGTAQYCTETNVVERIFRLSLQNITGSILSFAKNILDKISVFLFVFNEKLTEFGFNWTGVL